jgi:hypothetical protein
VVMLHAFCVLYFIFKAIKPVYILPFYDAYIFDDSLYLFGLNVPLHAFAINPMMRHACLCVCKAT